MLDHHRPKTTTARKSMSFRSETTSEKVNHEDQWFALLTGRNDQVMPHE